MKQQIAKEIKRVMEENGYTEYSILRDGISISRNTIRAILGRNGKGYNIDNLKIICDWLNISELTIDFKNSKTTIKF